MSSDVENGYTFRMGDHEITLRDSFSSMLESSQLTDCLLVSPSHLKETVTDDDGQPLTNGHSTPVSTQVRSNTVLRSEQILRTHRVILSASSDYFRSIFAAVPNTLNNGVVAIIVPNVDFEDLQAIIDFIYKGQVSVGQSRIHKFLVAAQLLMVKGLMNIKLVTQDDQPIDEHSFTDNETIQRLKNEKRVLEEKIRSLKDKDWQKNERMRLEIEAELKKKFEMEKKILSEEKQRFEAEKMKLTIEKDMFEKNKLNHNKSNSINATNKPIIVNLGKSYLSESLAKSVEKDKQNGIPNTSDVTPKSGPTTTEAKDNTSSQSTAVETEGRQLRKRIRLSVDVNDNDKQSSNKKQTNEDDNSMDVDDEEEDEDVYEVDFSQTEAIDQSKNAQKDTTSEVNKTDSTDMPKTSGLTTTPTIQKICETPIATPSQISTRSLRRSTSSIGSASTQSVAGENGTEAEPGVPVKRKGPGRPAKWVAENGAKPSSISDLTEKESTSGTPVTRNKTLQQRLELDDGTPQPIKHSPNSLLYTCPYCPQVYHGNQSMQDHINGVHLNQKTQYICDYCSKVYTWRISLNKHLRTMHPEAPIPE